MNNNARRVCDDPPGFSDLWAADVPVCPTSVIASDRRERGDLILIADEIAASLRHECLRSSQ